MFTFIKHLVGQKTIQEYVEEISTLNSENDFLNNRIKNLENENKAFKEKLSSSELENRVLRETLKTKEDKKNFVDIDILKERAVLLTQKANENFIFEPEEIEEMKKDKILGFLEENFERFSSIVEEIFKLKFEMQRMDTEAFENELIEISETIEKINESKKGIIKMANKRDLSIYKTKLTPADLNFPIFNDKNPDNHLYEFKQHFRKFLKLANISFSESSYLLYKCLDGRPKENVFAEHGAFESDVTKIFLTLEKYHGNIVDIVERLQSKLKCIEIPSHVSRRWGTILERSNLAIKYIKSLKYLEDVNENQIIFNGSLKTTLCHIVPPEHFNHLKLKLLARPENILQAVIDSIEINMVQARMKFKQEEQHIPSKDPICFLGHETTFKTDHGVYELMDLPTNKIYCSICKYFEASYEPRPHLICRTKFSAFVVSETCPFIRNKTPLERTEYLNQKGICRKCFISNEHEERTCGFSKKKSYLKCSNTNCFLRYSACHLHLDENKLKFQELNKITKKFNICVSN